MFFITWDNSKRYFFVFLPLFFSGMLIVNAFSNNGGLQEYFQLKKEVEFAKKNLELMKIDGDKLQNKISLISGQQLDQDLLEELAQKKLGYIYSNELILSLE